ncbi:MAG: XdhC family protein [Betaproteobacteria bacterium]|nr:XdhC family protein [Betaproteobacteria bacterium]
MKEYQVIVAEVDKLRAAGDGAVLATVVSVEGSAYRIPGARMLVTEAGWIAGSVSGGCLEGDVVLRAREVLESNTAVVVTYDTTSDEDIVFGVGLGCRGIIRVLIEPIAPRRADPDLVDLIRNCLKRRETGVAASVIRVDEAIAAKPGSRLLRTSDGKIRTDIADGELKTAVAEHAAQAQRSGSSALHTVEMTSGRAEVFVEFIRPALPVVVFGAGHDAMPFVRLARELGWHVTVVDHRPAYATAERFPLADEVILSSPDEMPARVSLGNDTLALVMTHNYLRDLKLLATLLPSPVRYVGLLGPRKRADQLLADLEQQGVQVTRAQAERFYAPVGLDLGSEGPEGVALSILAEMQAVVASRAPGHLRARKSSIHGGTSTSDRERGGAS